MVKIFRAGTMALVLATGMVSFGAETMPASPATPATPLPNAADYSEPKKTVESFLGAMQSGNEGATREALAIAPESKETVELFLKMIFATSKLQKAAMLQWGTAADKYFGTSPEAALAARMKLVADAPVKIAGDSAVMTIPASTADEPNKQAGGTIVLTRVGPDWKLDAASLFGLAAMSKEDQERQKNLATKLIPIAEQVTRDVQAGKYSAAVEAYQDFWQKSLDAMKAVNGATTMPATTPAK